MWSTLVPVLAISGGKSQEKKVGNIKKMLVDSKGAESKYVIRGLQGKLRIGLAEATVLVALGQAVTISNKDTLDSRIGMGSEKFDTLLEQNIINVKQAFSELPSYDKIVPALLSVGCEKVNEVCQLSGHGGVPRRAAAAAPPTSVAASRIARDGATSGARSVAVSARTCSALSGS